MSSNRVLIDIDDKKAIANSVRRILTLTKEYIHSKAIFPKDIKIYETNKGYHIYITFDKELDDRDILIFQLLAGSDPDREMFNYLRYLQKGEMKNVLFKRKHDSDGYISEERRTRRCMELEADIVMNWFFEVSRKVFNMVMEL